MDIFVPIGRFLFAVLFLGSGFNHFAKHGEMTEYARSKGVPAAGMMVTITGLMLLAGGLSALLGYRLDIGGWILVAFLLPAAFLMHAFWKESDPMRKATEMAQFMKNLALAGAAMVLAYFGGGPGSIG